MTRLKLFIVLFVGCALTVMLFAVGAAAACDPGPHGEMIQNQHQNADGQQCADGGHCQYRYENEVQNQFQNQVQNQSQVQSQVQNQFQNQVQNQFQYQYQHQDGPQGEMVSKWAGIGWSHYDP